jgi:N-acetylmuramoyl-L-alanine amidase
MNQLADVCEEFLRQHEITVYRNRPEMSLAQVVADSNSKKPDIHFAIHSNAGGGRGCEVFCHRWGGEGEKLSRAIYAELEPLTPSADRGIREGCNRFGPGKPLYELANTYAPAVLVEVSFHDNPDDAAWIVNNIETIGTALARGILKYFGIPCQENCADLNNWLNVLVKFGVIQSPDYWSQNAVKGKSVNGEYAAILIKRIAALLLNNKGL